MKLSLSWLFDHIDADWRTIDVPELVHLFNQKVAEIEGFEKITIDLDALAVARVKQVNQHDITVEIPEWNSTTNLPFRPEAKIADQYLVVRSGKNYSWATLADWASAKEGLIPALSMCDPDCAGTWKKSVDAHDYILHLDNKSVNHRPDMWGHRGVAREVAALLNLPLKPLKDFLTPAQQIQQAATVQAQGYTITVANEQLCKTFAVLPITTIENRSSHPSIAARLAKVDSRPIDTLVDITNYVMLDIGQPIHAFDARVIDNKITVRTAQNKEKITLLDGQTVELQDHDCMVADSKGPIALAGIMGGKQSGVTANTRSLLVEAACFDASTIRKTAARLKKRTEASARFEKSLDPQAPLHALERFLKLLHEQKVSYQNGNTILSVGKPYTPREITVTHASIEKLLGISIAPAFVKTTLEKLAFTVTQDANAYRIEIPSFRATKDIAIQQDIVEEIGRFYGYNNLKQELPTKETKPFDLTPTMRMRTIKELLAYGFGMQELYTYAFFDESFLQAIAWQPGPALAVQEAVSHNWQRLVTTLIPNLLKAVSIHAPDYDSMQFFEWARIWPQTSTQLQEKSCLVGIFVHQKKEVDFYASKQKLCTLARMVGMYIDWIKADEKDLQPWYLPHQTAYLMHNGQRIGTAGKANPAFLHKITTGDAFIFELDGDFLLSYRLPIKRYQPASKYPTIHRDISMLIPLQVTVAHLIKELKTLDAAIAAVSLVDFFQKPEWHDQKSLTFRIAMADPHATMTTEQADAIMEKVIAYAQKQGATVR